MVIARPPDGPGLRAEGFVVQESPDPAEDLRTLALLADQSAEPMLLCAADLVVADTSLGLVLAHALRGSVLVGSPASGGRLSPLQPPVVVQRGRVAQVDLDSAPSYPARTVFRGLLAADPQRLSATARGCAAEQPVAEGEEAPDALGLILQAMVISGEPVSAHRTHGLPSGRAAAPDTAEALAGAQRDVDQDQVRMRLAVKRSDDLFATYCVSSYSPWVVRWAARLGLTPTAVTWISVAVALLAALGFAQGGRPWLAIGSVLLYVSFVLDCVDGQLARYLQRYSRYGGWLDTMADRSKEYLVYAGLAVGAARSDVGDVWPLALAAMVLLTTRNMADAWYGALQDEMITNQARQPGRPPPAAAGAGPASESGAERAQDGVIARIGAMLPDSSQRLRPADASPWYWLKRSIAAPIGERWLAIGLTAPLFGARVTFLVLLGWGVIAAAYVLGGRTLRALHLRVPVMAGADRRLHRDDGVIARLLGRVGAGMVPPLIASVAAAVAVAVAAGLPAALPDAPWSTWVLALVAVAACLAGLAAGHPHDGPLDWLVPAALRMSEFAIVALLGLYAGVPYPLIYLLTAVLVIFHYDLTARLERKGSPVSWRWLALGWDGRIAVLAVAFLAGVATPAYAVLAGGLGALFLVNATVGAVAASRRGGAAVVPPRPRRAEPTFAAEVDLPRSAERAH